MIYGIDFDGTIVEEKFPGIGKPIGCVLDFIRDLQARGHKWILITMREGKYLDDAVAWLKTQGLTPDAVNDNLPERIEKWGNNPRKIYADIYIDDHNAGGIHLPGYSELSELEELRYIVEQFKKWSAEDGCPKCLNPDFPCSAEYEFNNDPETEGDFDEQDCWYIEQDHGCWVEYYRWKFRQLCIERQKAMKIEQ